jgi:hypothetical protein
MEPRTLRRAGQAAGRHYRYNRTKRRLYPEKPINYPSFSSLPKEKKAYNLRSAIEYPQDLAAIGCEIRLLDRAFGEPVTTFTDDEVEVLARYEHDRWMRSRAEKGWPYGPVLDDERRRSTCMIPYEQLSEDLKELDRDPNFRIGPENFAPKNGPKNCFEFPHFSQEVPQTQLIGTWRLGKEGGNSCIQFAENFSKAISDGIEYKFR